MDLFVEDYSKVNDVDFINWEYFRNKTLFVTGATGLVGASVINTLNYVNDQRMLGLKVIALVRNEERAKEKFKDIHPSFLQFVIGSIERLPEVNCEIDYIIHGASQTASKEFVEHAVETIDTAIIGTRNILRLAKDKNVKSVVYLSSMEVYGYPEKGHKVAESEIGEFTPLNLRNSYPIGKIMCETMCCAYAEEYKVPVKMVRLTQTFGTGVHYHDNRIFAYFGRCVKENKDIVLNTAGET